MKEFDSSPIVNIVCAEIITDEENARVMTFETVSSAEPERFISEGEETELRIRNTILAQNCLEDIIKGYNITLKDCILSRELLEVIDGGSSMTGGEGAFAGYISPVAGSVSERVRFCLRLYTSEKDYGGNDTAILRFSFPGCFGTPAKFSLENGAFVTPEYTVRSRPAAGGHAMAIEILDRLPIWCDSAEQLPEQPKAGDCIVAKAAIDCGGVELAAGESAYYNGESYVKLDKVC